MGLIELFLLGIGLSMDAFAVSICKGLATQKIKVKHIILAGLWFGGFQALMPFIGYMLGQTFQKYITVFDHWIAFILLVIIGANMIKEAFGEDEFGEDECDNTDDSFKARVMFIAAIATSIDALAVGVTFAFFKVNIIEALITIGITTFVFSGLGVFIGNIFGSKYKSKAELTGGIILILLGIKILLEHTAIFG